MANAIEFDFTKLETSINNAIGAIEQLDRRLADTAKSANTLDRLFGGMKQFKAFMAEIQKTDADAAANFQKIAGGLTKLVNAANKVTSEAAAEIGKIAAAIYDIRPADIRLGQEALIDFFKAINKVSLTAKVTEIEGDFKRLGNAFKEIINNTPPPQAAAGAMKKQMESMFKAIDQAGSLQSVPGKGQIDNVVYFISGVTGALEKIKPVSSGVTRTVNAAASAVRALASAFKGDIPVDFSDDVVGMLNTVVKSLKQLVEGIDAQVKPLDKAKTQTINSIGSLIRAYIRLFSTDIPEEGPGRLKSFVDSITDVIVRISTIPAMDTNLRRTVNSLSSVIGAMIRLQTSGVTDFSQANTLFDSIQKIFISISSLNVDNIEAKTKLLATTARTISIAVKFLAQKIPANETQDGMRALFASIREGFRIFATIEAAPKNVLSTIRVITTAIHQFAKVAREQTADTGNIQRVSIAIRQFIDHINAAPKLDDNATAVIRSISSIVTAFVRLNKGLNVDEPVAKLKGFVDSVTSTLRRDPLSKLSAFTSRLAGIVQKAGGVKNPKKGEQSIGFGNAIAAIIASLSRLANSKLDSLRGINLKHVNKIIEDIVGVLKSVAKNQNSIKRASFAASSMRNATTAIKTLIDPDFMNSLRTIGDGRGGLFEMSGLLKTKFDTKNITEFFDFVQHFANQMSRIASSVKRIEDVGTLANSFKAVVPAVSALMDISASFSSMINLGGRAKRFIQIGRTLSVIGNFVNKLASIGKNVRGLAGASTVASSLRNSITGLRELVDVSQELAGIFDIKGRVVRFFQTNRSLSIIGRMVSGLSGIAASIGNARLEGFKSLSGSISDISSGMKTFTRLAIDIAPMFSVTGRISRYFQNRRALSVISFIAKSLANIAGSIGNIGELRKLSASLDDLGSGIKKFFAFADNLPKSSIGGVIKRLLGLDNVSKALRVIERVVKGFAGISVSVGTKETGAIASTAAALASVGDFVKVLNKTDFGALTKGDNFFRKGSNLSKFLAIARDIGKALKGFKGLTIPNLGELADGLSKFITRMSAMNTGGKKVDVNREAIRNAVSDFAYAISELEKVKVSGSLDKKIAAMNALANVPSLRNFTQGAELKRSSNGIIQKIASTFQNSDFLRGIISGIGGGIGRFTTEYVLNRIRITSEAVLNFKETVATALLGLSNNFRQLGRDIVDAGQLILRTVGVQRLVQSQGFEEAASFDQLSSQLRVFGQLNDESLARAQAFANEIGIKYPQSSNEALEAILNLIKAGQDLNSIEFILPSAADLSALGDVDLPRTTQALIGAVGAFDEFSSGVEGSFENVADAANLFSAASDISTATLESLIDGLANVGPTANIAGLDLRETLAILSQFEDANIRGAESGTQLRSVLNSLASDRAKDELNYLTAALQSAGRNDISLSTQNADGSLRSLNDIIQSLNATYQALGFTEAQVAESVNKIADTYARQGIAVLLARNGYEDAAEALDGVGSASERAGELLDNFKGDVEQLTGSFSTLRTRAFLPMIRDAFRPLVQLARRVVDFFNELPDPIIDVISNGILLSSVVATIAGGLIIAVGAVVQFTGVLAHLFGTILLFTVKAPLLIPAFGAIALSVASIVVTVGTLSAAVVAASAFVTEFKNVIRNNIGGAGDAFEIFKNSVQGVFSTVQRIFREFIRVVTLVFNTPLSVIEGGFGERVAGFFRMLSSLSGQVTSALLQVGAAFEVFGNFIEVATGGRALMSVEDMNDEISRLARLPFIRLILGRNANVQGITRIFNLFKRGLFEVRNSVSSIASGLVGVLFGEPGALARVKRGFNSLFETISNGLQTLFPNLDLSQAIANFDAGEFRDGLAALVRGVFNELGRIIVANRGVIEQAIRTLIGFINPLNKVSFLLRVFGLDNLADSVDEISSSILDVIQGALSFVFDVLAGDVTSGRTLIDFITSIDVPDAIRRIAASVEAAVRGALTLIPSLLGNVGKALGIQQLVDFSVSVQNSEVFQSIVTGLSSLVSLPLRSIASVFDGVRRMITAANSGNTTAQQSLVVLLGALTAFLAISSIPVLGALLPVVATLGGIVGAFALIEAAFNNIDMLLQGDVGGFLRETFQEFAASVLGIFEPFLQIFGVDAEQGMANLQSFFTTFGDMITALSDGIARQLTRAIRSIVDAAVLAFGDARARIDIAMENAGLGSDGFGQQFFRFTDAFNTLDGEDLISALTSEEPIDTRVFDAMLEQNRQRVIDAFAGMIERYGSVSNIPSDLFDSGVELLRRASGIDDAIDLTGTGPGNRDGALEDLRALINDQNELDLFNRRISGQYGQEISPDIVGSKGRASLIRAIGIEMDAGSSLLDSILTYVRSWSSLTSEEQLDFLDALNVSGAIDQGSIQGLRREIMDRETLIADFSTSISSSRDNIVETFNQIFGNLPEDGRISQRNFIIRLLDLGVISRDEANELRNQLTAAIENQPELRPKIRITPEYEVDTKNLGGIKTKGSPKSSAKQSARTSAKPVAETAMTQNTMKLVVSQSASQLNDLLDTVANPGGVLTRDQFDQQGRESSKNQKESLEEKVAEIQNDFFNREYDLRLKFQRDSENATIEHQRALDGIYETTTTNLRDAIRRGDGAAAFQAIQDEEKQLRELTINKNEQDRIRQQNLDDELAQMNRELEERLADAARELEDQVAQDEALLEEQEDFFELQGLTQEEGFTQMNEDLKEHNRNMEGENRDSLLDQAEESVQHNRDVEANLANHNRRLLGSHIQIWADIEEVAATSMSRIRAQMAIAAASKVTSLADGQTKPAEYPTFSYPPLTGTSSSSTPVGAPKNPSILQTYTDKSGQTWLWNGSSWQRAYTAPGRASGGPLDPYSVYTVHDTPNPEIARMKDGRSLFFTGSSGGFMVPMPPNRNGYGAQGGNMTNVEVNVPINIDGGGNINVSEIVRAVETQVVPKITDAVRRGAQRDKGLRG